MPICTSKAPPLRPTFSVNCPVRLSQSESPRQLAVEVVQQGLGLRSGYICHAKGGLLCRAQVVQELPASTNSPGRRDERLSAFGPSQKLASELKDAIRKHGPELLKALTHGNRPAQSNQDTKSLKGEAESRRPRSDLPQGTRQDDRRTPLSDPDAQAGAYAGREVIADPIEPCPTHNSQAKRQEVLSMLAKNPNITYAISSDDETDSNYVIITLAIRGQATCELRIPKARYDGFKMLELIEQCTRQ